MDHSYIPIQKNFLIRPLGFISFLSPPSLFFRSSLYYFNLPYNDNSTCRAGASVSLYCIWQNHISGSHIFSYMVVTLILTKICLCLTLALVVLPHISTTIIFYSLCLFIAHHYMSYNKVSQIIAWWNLPFRINGILWLHKTYFVLFHLICHIVSYVRNDYWSSYHFR